MAETIFWGNEEDCIEIARRILEGGHVFVPDFFYPEPRETVIRVANEELDAAIKRNRLLYIGGEFAAGGIPWNQVHEGPHTRFAIAPGAFGRLLTLRLPGISKATDLSTIRPGSLGIATGLRQEDGRVVSQSPSIKAAYKDCVKRATRVMTKTAIGGRNAWLGDRMLESAAAGVGYQLLMRGAMHRLHR